MKSYRSIVILPRKRSQTSTNGGPHLFAVGRNSKNSFRPVREGMQQVARITKALTNQKFQLHKQQQKYSKNGQQTAVRPHSVQTVNTPLLSSHARSRDPGSCCNACGVLLARESRNNTLKNLHGRSAAPPYISNYLGRNVSQKQKRLLCKPFRPNNIFPTKKTAPLSSI